MSPLVLLGRVLVSLLLVPIAVVVAFRVVGRTDAYPLAPVLTVLPWLVLVALALTGAAAALRWHVGTAVAAVVTLVGVAVLLPRVLPHDQPDATGPTLTVAVANLRTGLADADTVVALVADHDVDVLVLPELTDDAITRLTAAGLDDLLAPVLVAPSRLTSGIGVWTRLEASVVRDRSGDTGRRFSRGTVEVALEVGDGALPVLLSAVHPLPPISAQWTDDWRATLADLPTATDDVLQVVAGDLNATLDHAVLRDVLDGGLVDAASEVGAGWRPTFSGLADGEPVPPVTLDHVLADRRVAVRDVAVVDLPGSDHRALVARLQLP